MNIFSLNNVYFYHKNIVNRIFTIVFKRDLRKLESLFYYHIKRVEELTRIYSDKVYRRENKLIGYVNCNIKYMNILKLI